MELSDREKEIVKGYIDRGEPLPAGYRPLFENDTKKVVEVRV